MDVSESHAFAALPGFTPYVPSHNHGYKRDGRVLDLQPSRASRMAWQRELGEWAVVFLIIVGIEYDRMTTIIHHLYGLPIEGSSQYDILSLSTHNHNEPQTTCTSSPALNSERSFYLNWHAHNFPLKASGLYRLSLEHDPRFGLVDY